jgi:hypothetical protein
MMLCRSLRSCLRILRLCCQSNTSLCEGCAIPFKSRAQVKKFFVLQREGKLKPGTALEWAHATPSIKALPERVKPKKSSTRSKSSRSTPTRKSR